MGLERFGEPIIGTSGGDKPSIYFVDAASFFGGPKRMGTGLEWHEDTARNPRARGASQGRAACFLSDSARPWLAPRARRPYLHATQDRGLYFGCYCRASRCGAVRSG